MRLAFLSAVLVPLALAGCGGDAATTADAPETVEAPDRICPELGKEGTDALYLERAEQLVGMELGAGEELAEERGCSVAPVSIDGESQPLTREFDPSRIQVHVRDDEITKVVGFG